MAIPLFLILVGYAAGLLLPLCFPDRPKIQNLIAHRLAAVAAMGGIYLGMVGLLAPEPLAMSVLSSLPLLTFAVRLDSLSSFFLLMISLVGLTASIYAVGYVTELYGRISIALLGSLYNGFLLSMTLVVLADNGFFFLFVW
jgi:hydrogenase-4 component B